MTTETIQIPLADFINDNRISSISEYTDSNPSMPNSNDMDHWRVKLINHSRRTRMTLTFSKGLGHYGKPPETKEVLDCLAMDASGIENAPDFEDWCGEYGYDTDSRTAERTYNATVKQTAKLRNFLGDDAFETLLWNTERD